MKPFALIPLAPEQNNPRHERATGGTVWTPEMVSHAEEQNRRHQAWLATEEGAAWFAAQPWNSCLPLARVRRLGLQQHPNGTSVMLYNRLDDGSTVTLQSLVKQGYRIEVVK